jgi:hypothetical protein
LKAQYEVNGQAVELDTSEMEQRINANTNAQLKEYFKKLEKYNAEKEKHGKGVVEAMPSDKKSRVIEEFRKGSKCDPQIIKEQWTIAVPKFAQYELAGHLRDYVWVTDVVKGKPGETVNIPYVNDVDFAEVVPHTGTFTATTGLVNVLTTTLKEAGAYYDAYYGDIEKIDSNLLDELNRVFAHAAVRAEDKLLIQLINTAVTGAFTSEGGGTETHPWYVGTTCATFDADLVVDALAALMGRGKEVSPGECILVLTPELWKFLVKDIIGSTPLTTARPDVAQRGIIEDFLGVRIVIVGCHTMWHAEQDTPASSYNYAYLMRPKRALALAPKRDILIETDKLIENRQLRIAASHTFGVCAVDLSEVMPIRTMSDPTTPP